MKTSEKFGSAAETRIIEVVVKQLEAGVRLVLTDKGYAGRGVNLECWGVTTRDIH